MTDETQASTCSWTLLYTTTDHPPAFNTTDNSSEEMSTDLKTIISTDDVNDG